MIIMIFILFARTPKETQSKHKSALLKLEDKDPEFFKFLKENDEELLKFDESDDDSDDTDNDDGANDGYGDDKHEASLESDEDKKVIIGIYFLMI